MEELQNLTPLYNKEFYLAYLCGEDVELPIPDGNTEHYLAYLCGMDVPIPDPLYTKEFYLAYKCGMDVELPEPGPYRIDQYLAKWCGMDVEVPEPMYRIEYWLAQLANSGELKTVSGNPISVSDALARPAESLVIEILPQQSGSGDPSPDNVRPISGFTGVNIYHESAYDPDADPTYSISWQDEAGTVYGGTLDVTTGVLTVTHGYLSKNTADMNNSANYPGWTNSGVKALIGEGKNARISGAVMNVGNILFANTVGALDVLFLPKTNYGKTQSEWQALAMDVQMVIPLATPITIQLTATEIEMLEGDDTLWADTGDITLTYMADGNANDVEALNILLGNRYVNLGEPDEATDREALEILLGGR